MIEGKLVLKGWVGLPENRTAFLFRDQISRGSSLASGGGKSELSKEEVVPGLEPGIKTSPQKKGASECLEGTENLSVT